MARAKMAPELQKWLWGAQPDVDMDRDWLEDVRREVRALLAVARETMREHGWTPGAFPCRPDCKRCRAFARVDRLSRGRLKP